MEDNMDTKSLLECLPTFQNRDDYYGKITEEANPGKKAGVIYLLLCAFTCIYGISIGGFHGLYQALAAGVKLPFLFTMSLVICFPAFYVIQFILGSKLRLAQTLLIILSGFLMMTAIMLAFVPIIIFFLLTGSNYYFLQLLHICVFIFSGVFGTKVVVDALKFSCEKKNIYPQIGVTVFRFWIVILAFVGIQLAWNLRPFLGDEGKPFKLFRKYEGNFYTAVIYSIQQLLGPNQKDSPGKKDDYYRNPIPYPLQKEDAPDGK